MELLTKYKTLMSNYDVNTLLRKAMFMAQIDHESGLKPISERTNYRREVLLKVFGKYFNESNVDNYYGKPEKILNKVYGNRMGNGNESSGDGYRYRGRGFIQLTGKNNYKALSEYTGIDYVSNPDLLLNEADAMIAALWFWKTNNLNYYADRKDLDKVSDIINIGRTTTPIGDSNGYAHRKQLYEMYLTKIK